MKTYLLQCFKDHKYFDSRLTFTQQNSKVQLEFLSTYKEIKVEDEFPFFALVKIRMELEKLGIQILCNGSRLDVYPSRMGMMSLKGYELIMGKLATTLLNIFEPTNDINKIATVKDQELYFENWIKSLRDNASK
jgi:hypothetical protein